MAEPAETHRHATHAPADAAMCPIMPTYGPPSVQFVRGQGARLWDSHGKEYVDFLSGIAVTSMGHANPVIAHAIAEQARTLLHVSNLYATEHNGHVANLLSEFMGQEGQTFFCNSGAEANEAAFKLARKWGGRGRHVVVTALRSFHGRTLATLHATGQPERHEPFQPLPEGFRHVAWDDLDALEAGLDDTVAAVMLEPVQGEGGINVPSAGYFQAVRDMCTERGILLMFDEIQTGLSRTGKWFAHQHFDVQPDVVTMAKALGNGVPIGACWARTEVAASFKPGDHATTFGGQPLATAAARATLELMREMDAPALAASRGEQLTAALKALPGVAGVRGLGLLLAVKIDPTVLEDRTAADIASACMDEGLVLYAMGKDSLRMAPPIVLSDDDLADGVAALGRALAVASAP